MSKSITEECGVPKDYTLAWVIDEFDSSFDDLAMASLRYHLDHAVTACEGNRRETYLKLLADFEEIRDRKITTAEHIEHIDSHGLGIIELLRLDCAECSRHSVERRGAEDAHRADQQAVRHRFVDIMPGLWS